jgi:hypothetical protein
MTRLLALGVAVVLGAVTGCGQSAASGPVGVGAGNAPTWGGCHEHSVQVRDYVADAKGEPTAEAAMAPYRERGDHVVVLPAHEHANRRWLLVDDTDVIHTSLELWHTGRGWLVTMVEHCSEP